MLLGFDAVGAAPVGAAPDEERIGSTIAAAQQLPMADSAGDVTVRSQAVTAQTTPPPVTAGDVTVRAQQLATTHTTRAPVTAGQIAVRGRLANAQTLAPLLQAGRIMPAAGLSGDTAGLAVVTAGQFGPRPGVSVDQPTLAPLTAAGSTQPVKVTAPQLIDSLVTTWAAVTRGAAAAAQQTSATLSQTGEIDVWGTENAAQATLAPVTAGQFGPQPGVAAAGQGTLAPTQAGRIAPVAGLAGDTAGVAVVTALAAAAIDKVTAAQQTQQNAATADFRSAGVTVNAAQSTLPPVSAADWDVVAGVQGDTPTLQAVTSAAASKATAIVRAQQAIDTLAQTGLIAVRATENAAQITQQNAATADIRLLGQAATAQATLAPVSAGQFGPRPGLATAQTTLAPVSAGQFGPRPGVSAAQAVADAVDQTGSITTRGQLDATQLLQQSGAIIRIYVPTNAAQQRVNRAPVTFIRATTLDVIGGDQLLVQGQEGAAAGSVTVNADQLLDPPGQLGAPLDRQVSAAQALPASAQTVRAKVETVARGTAAASPAATDGSAGAVARATARQVTSPVLGAGEAKTVLVVAAGQGLAPPVWIEVNHPDLEVVVDQLLPPPGQAVAAGVSISGVAAQESADLVSTAKAASMDAASAEQTLPAVVSRGRLRSRHLTVSPGALLPF